MPTKTKAAKKTTKSTKYSSRLKLVKQLRQKLYRKELLLLLAASVLLMIGVAFRPSSVGATVDVSDIADTNVRTFVTKDIRNNLLKARLQIRALEDSQASAVVQVVSDSTIEA